MRLIDLLIAVLIRQLFTASMDFCVNLLIFIRHSPFCCGIVFLFFVLCVL